MLTLCGIVHTLGGLNAEMHFLKLWRMKAQETLGRTVFSSGLCPVFVLCNLSSLWSDSFLLLLLIMTSLVKSRSEQQQGWKLPSERLHPDTNVRISLSVPGIVSAGHLEPQPSEPQTQKASLKWQPSLGLVEPSTEEVGEFAVPWLLTHWVLQALRLSSHEQRHCPWEAATLVKLFLWLLCFLRLWRNHRTCCQLKVLA